jgi:hypothetical protein
MPGSKIGSAVFHTLKILKFMITFLKTVILTEETIIFTNTISFEERL